MFCVFLIDVVIIIVDCQVLLGQVYVVFGVILVMFCVVVNLLVVLYSMWGLFGVLGGGCLLLLLGEQIVVVVVNCNVCVYCLVVYIVLGCKVGVSSEQMVVVQIGQFSDLVIVVVLGFVLKVVEQCVQIVDGDVQVLCVVGFDDEQIVEIFVYVVFNLFINYVNVVFDVLVDFLKVVLC